MINALIDALSERGVRHIDMPATPERVWRLVQARAPRRVLAGGGVPVGAGTPPQANGGATLSWSRIARTSAAL